MHALRSRCHSRHRSCVWRLTSKTNERGERYKAGATIVVPGAVLRVGHTTAGSLQPLRPPCGTRRLSRRSPFLWMSLQPLPQPIAQTVEPVPWLDQPAAAPLPPSLPASMSTVRHVPPSRGASRIPPLRGLRCLALCRTRMAETGCCP